MLFGPVDDGSKERILSFNPFKMEIKTTLHRWNPEIGFNQCVYGKKRSFMNGQICLVDYVSCNFSPNCFGEDLGIFALSVKLTKLNIITKLMQRVRLTNCVKLL
jgi:hypothetical protein